VEKDRKKTEEQKPLKDRITEKEKSWLLQQAKELVRQAEENGIDMDGVIMIPGWLQGNELREYLIEQ
jgi:mannose/cellobiose epimerase-like protein (N-acyl-D-glucosamine 2-epimerase family)